MALLTEWARVEDGRALKSHLDTFDNHLAIAEAALESIKAMVTKYPADATELNGYLASAKVSLQALLSKL